MYTLEQIGEFYKSMNLTSLSIKDGDFEISLSSQQACNMTMPVMSSIPTAVMPEIPAGTVSDDNKNDDFITINSPMVGIFDNGEGSNDKPFVKLGDTVKKGDIVGTIEAMKMFNDITASHDGIVEEICVSRGDMVEFNQPLFRLKPLK